MKGGRPLLLALAVLGVVLTATVVPGVFTVDEDHYLMSVVALRHGGLTVPGTEGLTPSRELRWFDPEAPYHPVESTPVSTTVPPLYAPLALPFSWFGWRGLVLLNTLAFLATALLVAAYAGRYHPGTSAPWLAAAAFVLGGYAIEYAQALWPHMLAAALVVGAAYLAARVRDGEGGWALAAGAGLLAGLAAGLRYQNVFLAACLGGAVFLWAPRRWRSATAFALGSAVPLAANSLLNRLRLGFWNPISKGEGYLNVSPPAETGHRLLEALTMAWARLGDFSTRPPLTGTEHAAYLQPHPVSGAYLVTTAVKKALLQSAPWLVLALVLLLVAWSPIRGAARGAGERRRELRALSLVIFPTLVLFAASGVQRTDGLSFNQRYFIELVPLAAVALAWAFPRPIDLRRPLFPAGLLAGLGLAAVALLPPPSSPARHIALLYVPLLLSIALLVAWLYHRRSPVRTGALLVAAALCLGWSCGVHLGDDLAASRAMRRHHLEVATHLDGMLPRRAALFAWWGAKDAVGSLLLDHDLVVADVRNDQGVAAPSLIAELRSRQRPIFVLPQGIPADVAAAMVSGQRVVPRRSGPLVAYELVPADGGAASP